jgi:hypothetical protein
MIVVAIAFNAAFALLAARFDYPDDLREPTADVSARWKPSGEAAKKGADRAPKDVRQGAAYVVSHRRSAGDRASDRQPSPGTA